MNLLAALFMTQLLYVIGVGGVQVTAGNPVKRGKFQNDFGNAQGGAFYTAPAKQAVFCAFQP
jgi:hypothetical protein